MGVTEGILNSFAEKTKSHHLLASFCLTDKFRAYSVSSYYSEPVSLHTCNFTEERSFPSHIVFKTYQTYSQCSVMLQSFFVISINCDQHASSQKVMTTTVLSWVKVVTWCSVPQMIEWFFMLNMVWWFHCNEKITLYYGIFLKQVVYIKEIIE